MQPIAQDTAPDKEYSLFQYYFRTLLCIAAAGSIIAMGGLESIDIVDAAVVLSLLCWPYLAFVLTRNIEGKRATTVASILCRADAAAIGAALALTQFNWLACALLFAMIQFNAALTGGIKRWANDSLAFVIGAGIAYWLTQPTLNWQPSTKVSQIAIFGVLVYFFVYAVYLNRIIQNLKADNDHLSSQSQQIRMRAYKLARYVSPQVWQSIITGKEIKLQTQRKKLTIFFSDIKGFTELTEEMEAEALTDLLNTYLTEMSKIADRYGATIDKFIGDAIMIFFGDPNSNGTKQDAIDCARMAIAMRKRTRQLQAEWKRQGIAQELEVRMGINTGYCTVGTFGTEARADYTLLGQEVNLASRLESVAQPGEILISESTFALVRDSILAHDKGQIRVKGFTRAVRVYQVNGNRADLGGKSNYLEHSSDGFSFHLDMDEIKNYDRDHIADQLKEALERLKD